MNNNYINDNIDRILQAISDFKNDYKQATQDLPDDIHEKLFDSLIIAYDVKTKQITRDFCNGSHGVFLSGGSIIPKESIFLPLEVVFCNDNKEVLNILKTL